MSGEAYFMRQFNESFGSYSIEDEDVHGPVDSSGHYASTETQYFGFGIPQHDIHALLYTWYHPILRVVSGGPMIMRGKKPISLSSEIFDYRSYLQAGQLNGSLIDFTLDNSYSVKMLDENSFHLRYDDPSRDSSFDVVMSGLSAPCMWPGNTHLDQLMRCRGQLTLRGEHYPVDCYGFRNRSWGEVRHEDPIAVPPIGRITGIFGDGELMFNIAGFDDPKLDPVWKEGYAAIPERTMKFGWISRGGVMTVLSSAEILTGYDSSLLPDRIQLRARAVDGADYVFDGVVTAGAPLNTWPNVRTFSGQVRWTFGKQTGWGEMINAQGNDFLHSTARRMR